MSVPFEALVQALRAALGTNVSAATSQLDAWQTHDGFHSALVDIVSSQTGIEAPTRQLALIRLRHGVEKYWKSRLQSHPLKEAEKGDIRSKIIAVAAALTDETSTRLAAAAIGKMARLDLPGMWPDLPAALHGMLQSCPLQGLPVTESILEEYKGARTKLLRAAVKDQVVRLYQPLHECFRDHYVAWIARAPHDPVPNQTLYISAAALRGLTRTIDVGYDSPHQAQEIVAFWSESLEILRQLVDQLDGGDKTEAELNAIADHLETISYFHMDLAWIHPVSFGALPATTILIQQYWETASTATKQLRGGDVQIGEYKQRVLTALNACALKLLRACTKIAFERVHTFKLLRPEDKEGAKQVSEFMKNEVVTEDLVRKVLMDLLSIYLVHDSAELLRWEDDAEAWEKDQEPVDDTDVQAIRLQAEDLLHDIVFHFKDQCFPIIEASIRQITGETLIQERNALYTATGAVASVMHDRFNYNDFLQQVVAPDFEKSAKNSKTLRHNTANLLGRMFFAIDVQNQPIIHILYQSLLDPNNTANDLAVRIAAAKNLRNTLHSYNFDASAFAPYAGTTMEYAVRLIGNVEDDDHQIMLIELVGEIIDAMGIQAVRFEDEITNVFGLFWTEISNNASGDGRDLMRLRSVDVMAQFMKAFGGKSYETAKSALGAIHNTIMNDDWKRHPDHVYASMQVLLQIVRTTDASQLGTDSFTQYFTPALQCFEQDVEWRDLGLDLTDSLINFDDNLCTESRARLHLFQALMTALDDRSPAILDKIAAIVERVLSVCHEQGGEAKLADAIGDLVASGITGKIIHSIHTNHLSRNSTSISPPKDAQKHPQYYRILARTILLEPEVFNHVLYWWTEKNGGSRSDVSQTFTWVITEWLHFLENEHGITPLEHEKKMAMAITRLLELSEPFSGCMLAKLQELMEMWIRTVKALDLSHGSRDDADIDGNMRTEATDSQVLSAEEIASVLQGVYPGAARQSAHTFYRNGHSTPSHATGGLPIAPPDNSAMDPTHPAARPLTAHERRVVANAAGDVVHRVPLREVAVDRFRGWVLQPRGWGRGDVEGYVELGVVRECWRVLGL
ncbi:MAG: hypothetical protein M1831_006458 [Alyxoria varia]|nr:MAG: hypothetical protein M1831_006458 [Alyxoria varia]